MPPYCGSGRPSKLVPLERCALLHISCCLRIHPRYKQARLVVASASGDTSYMSQSIDVVEGDAETQTRILVCELREGPQLDGSDMALVKKGDWVLDGPAESVGFYQEMDGASCLLVVTMLHSHLRGGRHTCGTLHVVGSPSCHPHFVFQRGVVTTRHWGYEKQLDHNVAATKSVQGFQKSFTGTPIRRDRKRRRVRVEPECAHGSW